ncbi:hypothetical protein OYS96_00260 [Raoultella ornithinolytica]|uniref:hypothetical protein n=1 Tax=Raoultella ornithinolytica TaxID=54291 RepID=UPI0022838B0A|nr:hypothetical protein [Raoultella ornithinolytica]MCZ0098752.1 hypothetical protein [Raoultella ornithinolytica]HEC2581865.1 hypothetical protein [Raoultella ornithinolytica]HEC2583450.1 hypothetical protein [Raoultella ornithinolytica]HEC2588594.1 hypothetical protein [Raoultella ornithinolytica]HEC2589273.1 hypothetical protein [Raoultella ornithinolytica]
MGFASPATDYVETRLSVDSLCGTGPNTRIIETDSGYAVIDLSLKPRQQSTVLIAYDGLTDFAKIMGRAFITRDGEAIEGDALDDVHVLGVVTFTIIDVREDSSPV